MAEFEWTLSGTGDWSTPENWTLLLGPGSAPPGSGDIAIFANAGAAYRVNVTTTVDVGDITVIPTTSLGNFSISGTLTADFLFGTPAGGPATLLTIADGGALIVPSLIFSTNVAEVVAISGKGGGGHVTLGNLTVGGDIFGNNANIFFDFANSQTGPNTGVIQFDGAVPRGAITTQSIDDVAWGNEFVFTDADFTGDTVSYDSTNSDVIVKNASNATVFTMAVVSLQPGFAGGFEIVNGNTIEAVCYARGTMIRTPVGELPVEKLRPGKQVITLVDGQEIPQTVTWLGHRRISLAAHPRPETVAPIRIRRDAFADGVPHRDLIVSPDHAIFVDGKLICARQLVNGATIRQERGWTAVDYYHVELGQHAILLAEGLPAESYIDTGNSGFFANSGAPLVLHPDLTDETDYPTREAGSCEPFVWDEASVQPVWQKLADRAVALGQPMSQHGTTTDADLRLLADRRTVRPVFSDSERAIFVLPRGARGVRLVSRAQSPTEARPWLDDRRRLGVRVKRIVLRGADELREIPVDHPDLSRGWWAVERDGQLMSRWTNGEAVLPLSEMSGPVMLEIRLAGSMTYAVEATPEGGMEQRAAA